MPSSTTAMSGRTVSSSSESGSPMWLFRFPALRYTAYPALRNDAAASFVDVLPALPVIATTRAPDLRRTNCPSCWSASSVSSASITAAEAGASTVVSRGTSTPHAPAARLPSANAAPSNRSPRSAMNNCPATMRRESVVNPPTTRSAGPCRSRPPAASATCAAVSTSGARSVATSSRPGMHLPPPRQRRLRNQHVVERQLAISDDLRLLVAFARDDHEVARPRQIDRARHGLPAVDDGQHLGAARRRPGAGNAPQHFLDDPDRI